MVVMRLIRLAEYIPQRAQDVEPEPARVQPIEAGWCVAHQKMQEQMRPRAHQQAGEGDELEAIESRRAVKFGEVHGKEWG